MASNKKWKGFFNKALDILRDKSHPIAKYTLGLIENKTIEIIPFSRMRKADFAIFRQEYNGIEEVPASFPPSKTVVQKIATYWRAKIIGNRISIDDSLAEPSLIAIILVHEANHFLNKSCDNYGTVEQRFTEEFRAKVAEALVFSRTLGKRKLKQIAIDVADRFDLPHPKTVTMPKGLFVPNS